MISGRTDDILAHIDNGYVPGMFMAAYKVTASTTAISPTLTRDNTHDIPADHIDMTSIHFEASQIPGSEFTPGGVIPAHLKFDILNYSDLPAITEKKDVTSTQQLDYVYRMVIVYNNTNYIYGPLFAATLVKKRFTKKTNVEFDDVLFILGNRNCDLAGYSQSPLDSVAAYIMQDAGFTAFHSEEIYSGANYYSENQINARQALSYILQINGLFLRPYTYGYQTNQNWSYIASPLKSYSSSLLTLDEKYVFDYEYNTKIGYCRDAFAYPKGADHSWMDEYTYCVDDNPLITQGNRGAYSNLLPTNMSSNSISRRGFTFTIPMMPFFELGDYILVYYKSGVSSLSVKNIIISRIEWDGGMFMKITEASAYGE